MPIRKRLRPNRLTIEEQDQLFYQLADKPQLTPVEQLAVDHLNFLLDARKRHIKWSKENPLRIAQTRQRAHEKIVEQKRKERDQ